ncbi:hypothetical protein [Chitinophaga tropicalis]|uniref:Uncharacterized protein n=1 Tax=Chitinophaga tropicalis TaxID=2683588 RepID=A0A7K1U7B5_9BACT|nr:hypothetical protein [Chitinophaga tropicalis]MVT10248.1 hypothetical protein [Chitinophaga tropicalis]
MRISRKEIEVLFELVLKKLTFDKFEEIHFIKDEYWIITTDEWQNFDHAPKPGVASLVEDVSYLKQSIENHEIHSYSDLDRLASVLRVISENQAPTNQ